MRHGTGAGTKVGGVPWERCDAGGWRRDVVVVGGVVMATTVVARRFSTLAMMW
jgi:hypothetical protein